MRVSERERLIRMQRQNVVFLCSLLLMSVLVLLHADLGWNAQKSLPPHPEEKLTAKAALHRYPAQDLYYPEEEEGGERSLTLEGRKRMGHGVITAVDDCPSSTKGCLRGRTPLLLAP